MAMVPGSSPLKLFVFVCMGLAAAMRHEFESSPSSRVDQAGVAMASAGKAALLLIDVQDCFLEAETSNGKAGSLAVSASQIIPVINEIRAEKGCLFDVVVRTQDYHPVNHISFGSTHGLDPFTHLGGKGGLPLRCVKPASGNTADASCCPTQYVDSSLVDCGTQLCPPEGWSWAANNSAFLEGNVACTQCKDNPDSCFDDTQAMWTDHCLQQGDSTFPPGLTTEDADVVVQKGMNVYVDAYSAFMDNSQNLKTSLDATLQEHGVDTLYVAGIATDVCVMWTVRDALSDRTSNYTVKVISDASAGLSTDNHDKALVDMAEMGAMLVSKADILAMSCPQPTAVSSTTRTVASLLSLATLGVLAL